MNRSGNLFRHLGFQLLLFILAVVLFCRPFAGSERSREAISLFIYLFAVWGFVIAALFGIFLGIGPAAGKDDAGPGRDRHHV